MDVGIVNGYCQLQFTALLTSSVFCRTVTCVAKNEKYETTTFCRELIKMNISRTLVFSYRTRFANKTFYFGTGTFFANNPLCVPKKNSCRCQFRKNVNFGTVAFSCIRWTVEVKTIFLWLSPPIPHLFLVLTCGGGGVEEGGSFLSFLHNQQLGREKKSHDRKCL